MATYFTIGWVILRMNYAGKALVYCSIFLSLMSPVCSQKACGCCYDSVKAKRVDILGDALKQEPFSNIVHLFVNSGDYRGTASFIANNILVTATHNLYANTKAKTLFLVINSKDGDTILRLKKNAYSIIKFGDDVGVDIGNDISLVVLKKK